LRRKVRQDRVSARFARGQAQVRAKDLSQDRLSKAADVSYNSIIKLETGGITNPTIETLQKIAKALDVSVDDLLK